jgi:hypothetical protein
LVGLFGVLLFLGFADVIRAQEFAEDREEGPSATAADLLSFRNSFSGIESSSRSDCAPAAEAFSAALITNALAMRMRGLLAPTKCLAAISPLASSAAKLPTPYPKAGERFNWRGALLQSLFFLSLEHAFRLTTQMDTRAQLKGPFFQDYLESVSHLRGWRDGDTFLINYIGHPMQGAVSGFIQIQNDPNGRLQEFGWTKDYRASRLKAILWNTLYSIQFEVGPISESSIGNVGLHPNAASNHPQAYVDLIVTPFWGTIWMLGEDALDKYLIAKYELKFNKRVPRALLRSCLNPARSFSNLMRFQVPWFRDNRDPTVRW